MWRGRGQGGSVGQQGLAARGEEQGRAGRRDAAYQPSEPSGQSIAPRFHFFFDQGQTRRPIAIAASSTVAKSHSTAQLSA